jgi:DNA repair protein RecN (Recombination protein N)
MLEELLIRNLGVIDEATLVLAPGLNVLTGETGAGKTMVVSALELLLGARADADRVRVGAGPLRVEGRFHPVPSTAADWADAADEDLVVAREVSAGDGGSRSRARLGGRLAPASALAEVLAGVVEVHGQGDTARLAAPAVQRELLDRSGGGAVATARSAYAEAYAAWRAAADELAGLEADDRERVRERDRLAYELAEIADVAPVPGEEDGLEAELRRLEHAEALRAAATTAAAAITDEGAARDGLGVAVAALRAVEGVDEALEDLRRRAEGLAAEAQDLALELGTYAEDVALDPARLEELRNRQGALTALCRKYGPSAAAVVAYAEQAQARLADLEGGQARLAELAGALPQLEAAVEAAAAGLRSARRAAGERLAATVDGHLAELAMTGARMQVEVEPVPPAAHGADRVSFVLAANAGAPSLPIAKAASGGERSRIALALRLALADADATPVLVFDEVDAGIGGATALAVGRKLAELARGGRGAGPGRQVLCVTHLAQLAAFADAHFVVEKHAHPGRTTAAVRRLEEAERVSELSRMLSGTDSAAAAEHAAELRTKAVAQLG